MCAIARWAADNNYDEKIHYIFSGGDGEGGNLERLFNDLMNSDIDREFFHLDKGYSRLGYGIEAMKGAPALQAADITTFESQKIALNWFELSRSTNPTSLMRKSMQSLSKSEYFGWIYDKPKCTETFTDIIRFENERAQKGLK